MKQAQQFNLFAIRNKSPQMDKLINYKRHSLNNVDQILKMQNLLEEYDRQNVFLNKQVDNLLKQNIKLKQQQSHQSLYVSRTKPDDYHYKLNSQHQDSTIKYQDQREKMKVEDQNIKARYEDNVSKIRFEEHGSNTKHNNTPYLQSNKPHLILQPRKSKYEYLFDQQELKDLKINIKNELKSSIKKNISNKEVQTNTQQTPQLTYSRIPACKTAQSTPIKKPLQTKKMHQSRVSQSKTLWQSRHETINEFDAQNITISKLKSKQKSPSKSKSKQKQTSQKKLEIISRSRIYLEKNITTPSKNITQTTQQQKPQPKQGTITKELYLEKSDVLQHSFGQNKQKGLQKRTTLLQSDLSSGLKEQNVVNNESRATIKMMPLSIETKEIFGNLQKREGRQTYYNYNESIINRTQSHSKRKHSLNPSPKVDFKPSQLFAQKVIVQPFMVKTEQALPVSSVEMSRNPIIVEQKKRKFIKIVSSKKFSIDSSPKKK